MKCPVKVRLPEQLLARLAAAAARRGVTRTAMIEAALVDYLAHEADGSVPAATLQRLNFMSRQLEQLERDLRIVNETAALHARYHLTVTPQATSSQHDAVCALGRERFEAFAAQVGTRVHLGLPLMRETIDRLGLTRPELFPRDFAQARGEGGAGKAAAATPAGPPDDAAAGQGGSAAKGREAGEVRAG